MKVLIFGHRGLVGSACMRHFKKNGYEVFCDNYRGDLRNHLVAITLIDQSDPDAIIHCAAKVGGVLANKSDPVGFYTENVAIQESVLFAAHECGVSKVVSLGTSCLFPNSAEPPICEESLMTGPFEESVSAYATAKLGGYVLSKAYHDQYGCNFMTGCPANVFGLGDTYDDLKSHVVPALIMKFHKAIKSSGDVEVWGDGSAVREFIYADDLAESIEYVMLHWNKPDLINLGTGISTSIRELVTMLRDISRFSGKIIYNSDKPTGINRKTFNIDKINSLGWQPKYSLYEALQLTWDDYCKTYE